MLSRTIALLALTVVAATPSLAQKKPPVNLNVGDPNERICQTIKPVGSRLATKRFCGTRAEWLAMQRQDREALDAAQKGPCVLQTTGATGRPSC